MIFKAQFLQKQASELEENLSYIDKEIGELQRLDENLDFLSKTKETSSISSLGKGIHVKTNLDNKDLFVEVGSGVVVKKKPEKARIIIQNQIKKLVEARLHLLGQLEIYHKTLESIMHDLEKQDNASREHTH